MKEKDFDEIVPRVGFCDMSEETQASVVATCKEACKMQHDGEFKYYKDMAIYVKTKLDKDLGYLLRLDRHVDDNGNEQWTAWDDVNKVKLDGLKVKAARDEEMAILTWALTIAS